MKNDKPTSNNSAITTPENQSNVVMVEEPNTSRTSRTNRTNKNTANASSQMQLLGLARQFVIDGALLPEEKQLSIEDRTIKRQRIAHLRKQQNIESIIQKAIQHCSDSEVTDRADKDWFNSFIELAEDVSNKTMQDLWAKILAGEISSPGSFSLKSLKAFRTMSIIEAKLLAKACALAMKDHSRKNIRIISGAAQMPGLTNFFSKNRERKINLGVFGLTYSDLLTLADNHLIFIQEAETLPIAKKETLTFTYNGANLTFSANKKNCLLSFYKFTPIGSELAELIMDKPNSLYLSTLKQEFTELFSIIPS